MAMTTRVIRKIGTKKKFGKFPIDPMNLAKKYIIAISATTFRLSAETPDGTQAPASYPPVYQSLIKRQKKKGGMTAISKRLCNRLTARQENNVPSAAQKISKAEPKIMYASVLCRV
jgi:hypothetical protein